MRCFAYIYKAILLAKNSGHSGYFAKIDVLHTLHDSGYFAKIIQFVSYKDTHCISSAAARLLDADDLIVQPEAAVRFQPLLHGGGA